MSAKVSRTVLKTSTPGDRRAEFNGQESQVATFPVDHIIPVASNGKTELENLALACPRWK
jgi:hypothetical protein